MSNDKLLLVLGVHIKALRENQNLSQNKLSILSGVTRQTLIKIENGSVKNPRIETFNKLLKVLKCKLEILIVKNNH